MAKKKENGTLGRVIKYLILIAIILAAVLFIRTRLSADISAGGKNMPTFQDTPGGRIYFDTGAFDAEEGTSDGGNEYSGTIGNSSGGNEYSGTIGNNNNKGGYHPGYGQQSSGGNTYSGTIGGNGGNHPGYGEDPDLLIEEEIGLTVEN